VRRVARSRAEPVQVSGQNRIVTGVLARKKDEEPNRNFIHPVGCPGAVYSVNRGGELHGRRKSGCSH